jgi:hypothetical protein
VDIEQTTEQQLLAEAKKQTSALESLRGFAMAWMALFVIGALTWIFVALAH